MLGTGMLFKPFGEDDHAFFIDKAHRFQLLEISPIGVQVRGLHVGDHFLDDGVDVPTGDHDILSDLVLDLVFGLFAQGFIGNILPQAIRRPDGNDVERVPAQKDIVEEIVDGRIDVGKEFVHLEEQDKMTRRGRRRGSGRRFPPFHVILLDVVSGLDRLENAVFIDFKILELQRIDEFITVIDPDRDGDVDDPDFMGDLLGKRGKKRD